MVLVTPPVLTKSMDIITDPSCITMDLDMALDSNSGLDVTRALVAAQSTQTSGIGNFNNGFFLDF